jgi:hypothetical protein
MRLPSTRKIDSMFFGQSDRKREGCGRQHNEAHALTLLLTFDAQSNWLTCNEKCDPRVPHWIVC